MIDQGTHQPSAHPSSRSGYIVPCLLSSLYCCFCSCCLLIFVQTPPRLAWWPCSLLLVVVSWTPSSCWGGWLDLPYFWGNGRLREGICWTSRPSATQTLHCLPPPISCMRGISPSLLPLLPHPGAIAHSLGCLLMVTSLWAYHAPKPVVRWSCLHTPPKRWRRHRTGFFSLCLPRWNFAETYVAFSWPLRWTLFSGGTLPHRTWSS